MDLAESRMRYLVTVLVANGSPGLESRVRVDSHWQESWWRGGRTVETEVDIRPGWPVGELGWVFSVTRGRDVIQDETRVLETGVVAGQWVVPWTEGPGMAPTSFGGDFEGVVHALEWIVEQHGVALPEADA